MKDYKWIRGEYDNQKIDERNKIKWMREEGNG